MGETISHEATGGEICPVHALAHLVHHILSHGGKGHTLLCSYRSKSTWHTVTAKEIIDTVRSIAAELKLHQQGIDGDLIGAHSLRAGGAMAYKLHGESDTTIMKMERWTSLTFLQYIHHQIAHLAKDISRKMSIPLPFTNVAAIEREEGDAP